MSPVWPKRLREGGLSVVIMAWNEERNLPLQVERCRACFDAAGLDWELVLVDDGSTDGTGPYCDDLANREPGRFVSVRHPRNLGMGVAIRNGYAAARKRFLTQLPGDAQVRPEMILRLLPCLSDVDLVLSVYTQRGDGRARALLSKSYQFVAGTLLGARADFTGTMVLERALLDRAPLRSLSFFVNMELPTRLLRLGVPFRVVEITCEPRAHGRSRVATVRRIAQVFGEIVRMRLESGRVRRTGCPRFQQGD